jgi:hypothetical protein
MNYRFAIIAIQLTIVLFLGGCSLGPLKEKYRQQINVLALVVDVKSAVVQPYVPSVGAAVAAQGGLAMVAGAFIDSAAQQEYEKRMRPLMDWVQSHKMKEYIENAVIEGIRNETNYSIVKVDYADFSVDDESNKLRLTSDVKADAYLKIDLQLSLGYGLGLIHGAEHLEMKKVVNGVVSDRMYEGYHGYQSLPIMTPEIRNASSTLRPVMEQYMDAFEGEYPNVLKQELTNSRKEGWLKNDGQKLYEVINEALSEFNEMLSLDIGNQLSKNSGGRANKKLLVVNQITPGANSGAVVVSGQVLSKNGERYIIRNSDGRLFSLSKNMNDYARFNRK